MELFDDEPIFRAPPPPEKVECPHCTKMRAFSHQSKCERNPKNVSAKSDSGILFPMVQKLQQQVADLMNRKPLTFEEVKLELKKLKTGQLHYWIFKNNGSERNTAIRDIVNIYNTIR